MNAVQTVRRGAAGLVLYAGMMLFGGVFVLGPLIGPVFSSKLALDGPARTVLVAFGALSLAVGCVLTIVTKLYVKADSDIAWVKTGMGGRKAVLDGGTIAVPFAHSMTPVALTTMKLKVERKGAEALLTHDKLRADVIAEFYIRVQKDEESVLAAATSMGSRCTDSEAITELMFEKLVSALRSFAATSSLADLNSKRDEFAKQVQELVKKELQPNGLTLETVTISHLDQTPPTSMRGEDNVFDSEGLKTIAEITQANLLKRRQIELDTARSLKEREVQNAKFLAEQDVQQAKALADSAAQTAQAQAEAGLKSANAKSEADAKASAFAAEQEKVSGKARVDADQMVKLAQVSSSRQVQMAEVARDQEVKVAKVKSDEANQTAEIEKSKTIEVQTREKEIAVAVKETERANAEGARLVAEKARESAAQAVKTVQAVADAERSKETAIIAQQAKADQTKIEQNMTADVAAYQLTTKATAESTASEKEAQATLRRAEAEKQASVLRAEGQKAEGLVPVQVANAQVEVEAARVQVLKSELEAKTANQEAAIKLQIALAQIAADKESRIAFAQAVGTAMGSAKMQIYGDPQTFQAMMSSWTQGTQQGEYVSALVKNTPDEVKSLITMVAGALAQRFAGKSPTADELAAAIKESLPLGKLA